MPQNIYNKLSYKYFGKIISFVAVGALILFTAVQSVFTFAIGPDPGDVVINEFSSASDTEWVELLNTTDDPRQFRGLDNCRHR